MLSRLAKYLFRCVFAIGFASRSAIATELNCAFGPAGEGGEYGCQVYNLGGSSVRAKFLGEFKVKNRQTAKFGRLVIKNNAYYIECPKPIDGEFERGELTLYYENGNRSDRILFMGCKENGLAMGFYQNGNLRYKAMYNNGVATDMIDFNEDGSVKSR